MSRRGRRNWSNLEINKRICKQLILHRVWNNLSQTDLSKDMGTTFQQYQKVEKCYNRIFAEQLISICNNRKWDISIFNSDPNETLKAWIFEAGNQDLEYDKKIEKNTNLCINKIKKQWDILDANAAKCYYGNTYDPDDISNIKPIIPKGD